MADLISGFARSAELIGASAKVLKADKELLVLPILSGIASAAVMGAFFLIAQQTGTLDAIERAGDNMADLPVSAWIQILAFYVVQYFIVVFFNTALVGAAITRLGGGDPTLGQALALSVQRIGPIAGYALIMATVGVVLRMVSERFGLVGRFLAAGASIAWGVLTFLVIPVIAAEGLGPIAAISKSGSLLRQTWGENIVGNAGIALILGLAAAVIMMVSMGLGLTLATTYGSLAAGFTVFGIGAVLFIALIIFSAALSGVYAAAVYYYAALGETPAGFDGDLIRRAFDRKDQT